MTKRAKKLPGEFYFSTSVLPVALRYIEGGRECHEHDYTGRTHYHDFAELVIITEGEGIQEINGRRYPVSVGDVFLLQDRTSHCFIEYGRLKITNIMFSRKLFRPMDAYLHRIPGYNVVFRIEPGIRGGQNFRNCLRLSQAKLGQVAGLLRRLDSELRESGSGHEAAAIGLLFEIIVFLSRSFSEKETDQRAALRLGKLLSELEARFAESWSLEAMAKEAAMSVNNFLRIFRAATGETPVGYLNTLRLNHACRLLQESGLSISEIAFACGFRDSNYFSKKFSARFGTSPREFRNGSDALC